MLGHISTTHIGLSEKMEHNRKDTHQIHETQTQMEKRMGEEEKKNSIGEIKKIAYSVTQQEEKMFGERMYDRAMVPQVSILGVKTELKVKEPP